jgi:hypothetical protein
MSSTIKAALLLGVTVFVWTLVVIFSGAHTHAALGPLLFIAGAIILNLLAIIYGLRLTAREGRGYGGQVLAGLMIGILAAVLIFCGSLATTTVIFPGYFADLEQGFREILTAQGMSPEQIQEQVEATAAMRSPMANAFSGAVATVITSVVLALIVGAFVRHRAGQE